MRHMFQTALVRIIDLASSSCLCLLWATHHYDTCLVVMDTPDSYRLGLIKEVGRTFECQEYPWVKLFLVLFLPSRMCPQHGRQVLNPQTTESRSCHRLRAGSTLWSCVYVNQASLNSFLMPKHLICTRLENSRKFQKTKALGRRMMSTFFGLSFFIFFKGEWPAAAVTSHN